MTSTLPPPLKIWDVQTGENYPGPGRYVETLHAWVEAHGIVKEQTYRIEYHLIDAPFIRVFQYDVDGQGRCYVDPADRDRLARRQFDVLVTSPPPQPEDYT